MPSKITMRPGIVLFGMIVATGLTAIGGAVSAQKSADTLRLTWRDAVPNVTPDHNLKKQRSGIVIGHHAWDLFVYREPDTFQIKPLLWIHSNG